eukprot:6182501-Pleurochrysis_carterae.AAC.2
MRWRSYVDAAPHRAALRIGAVSKRTHCLTLAFHWRAAPLNRIHNYLKIDLETHLQAHLDRA